LVNTDTRRVARIIREVKGMLDDSEEPRATALNQLKEAEHGDPFAILIGTILSQRTRDEVTTKATVRLLQRYRSPRDLAMADAHKVAELIKPVTYYDTKAPKIIEVARQIEARFHGSVPTNFEDLLTLPLVGRKTANCVLVYGFGIPAIPVDTHVHRISNRLGMVNTRTPEQTEVELARTLPRRYWLEINDLFVRFGQTVCLPLGPRCNICRLRTDCRYYREVVSKKGAPRALSRGKCARQNATGERRRKRSPVTWTSLEAG
jgi:endonuclease III